jgi:hypothetical protein
MVKKAGIVMLVIVILAAGYVSFKKLSYLERSIAIFKLESPSQSFEGRDGRNENFRPGFREGMQNQGRTNMRDSLRAREDIRGQRGAGRDFYKSENRDFNRLRRDTINSAGERFGGRMRGPDGFGGHGDRRGKTINLNMVGYYLAVFAFFTLIVVYIEKGYCMVFKRKNRIAEDSDLII